MVKIKLDLDELNILNTLKHGDKTIWFQKFKKYIKNLLLQIVFKLLYLV